MTQLAQESFDRSVEDAWEWMRAVQDRLQVNDNTQGPRAALEARLRETEVGRGRGLRSPMALATSLPLGPHLPGLLNGRVDLTLANFDVFESSGDLGLRTGSDAEGHSGCHPRHC